MRFGEGGILQRLVHRLSTSVAFLYLEPRVFRRSAIVGFNDITSLSVT